MRIRSLVGASCAALALTACSTSAPPPTGPSPQAVSWVDTVCGAMRSVQQAGGTQPEVDQGDPAAAVTGLQGYFGGVVTAVASARTTLRDAGPSPVAGADADVARIDGELGQVQTAFQTAQDMMKGVDPANPQSVATGLTAALTPVQQLQVASDPIGDLRRNPEFDTVAKDVPSCAAT